MCNFVGAGLVVSLTRVASHMLYLLSQVLLYDHLLTFSVEVGLIWAARWSVPKVLFLLLRYFVPSSVIIHTHRTSFGFGFGLSASNWFAQYYRE